MRLPSEGHVAAHLRSAPRCEALKAEERAWELFATETASLRDTRSGSVYREGAYRVRIERKPALPNQPRTKTFKGETAWSHAESYARDARWWFNRYDYDVAV